MATTKELLKPFVFLSDEYLYIIEKDMGIEPNKCITDAISKNAEKIYTNETLNTIYNDDKNKIITKDKYMKYCVGYIQRRVIGQNIHGYTNFEHYYDVTNYVHMYNSSAEEFNQILLEKIKVMFPDMNIIIINRTSFNYLFSSEPVYFSILIQW
jgi:hypothetical protein